MAIHVYPVISTSPLAAVDSDSAGRSIIIDTVGIGLSTGAGLAVISVCPPGRRAIPFCPVDVLSNVFCPFSVAGMSCATSRALFSLNCRYVVVFGITSARNSRLSIRETAVAIDCHRRLAYCRDFPYVGQRCVPRSLYWMVFRGLRSDLTTLYPCSAIY
jgi:hypothetical protein